MGIPKPLVQTNQAFIFISVLLALFIHKAILIIPLTIGIFTLITKQNPIISIGKRWLSKPLNKYPQEDKDRQIFNQWIATICIGLSTLFFYFGLNVLGYVFSIMVLAASGIALMGFCIGCFIRYRYLMWKHKRANVQS